MEPDLFAKPTDAETPPVRRHAAPTGLPLYLGTSSWSFDDWRGTVYPSEAKSADYLTHYARRFMAVEIDMTFYRIPTASMVERWHQNTPDDFRFAAKIPQIITHEKMLRDCQAELRQFTDVMALLGDKLGPLLFQFPYFSARQFRSPQAFLERLESTLDQLPEGKPSRRSRVNGTASSSIDGKTQPPGSPSSGSFWHAIFRSTGFTTTITLATLRVR
jgi:uncharacterized protein YecE (DUF72 family)